MSRLTLSLNICNKKMVVIFLGFLLFYFCLNRVNDYIAISAIEDSSSYLISIDTDGAMSIGGLKINAEDRTKYKKEGYPDKWYFKNDRKLTDEEYSCLTVGVFSAAIIDGYLNVVCMMLNKENKQRILYIK